jgi:hypothetical protein
VSSASNDVTRRADPTRGRGHRARHYRFSSNPLVGSPSARRYRLCLVAVVGRRRDRRLLFVHSASAQADPEHRSRPGDIVRVDKNGRVFEAFVLAKPDGVLEIEPIGRGVPYTTATACEVVCHWAKRGRGRKPRSAAPREGST